MKRSLTSLLPNLLLPILILSALLNLTYAIVVPPFEASDELWHYPMVKYIADHWALPVQQPGVETAWRQEGSQPPLYYFLTALATAWIDTSDMEAVRYLNPHVDNGVATPDGNVNLVVHDPAREAFPWRGTTLAVRLIRFLSALMGVASVYLTYLIAREVFPDWPQLALAAAAIHAFTPMVAFISGAVNNDNLAILLSNLALLLLLRIANQQIANCELQIANHNLLLPTPYSLLSTYLPLGLVLGLAALTKLGWPALAGLTALVVTLRAIRNRSWREFVVGGLATATPLVLIAGWWYWRNFRLYGDWLGLNVFKLVLGTRDVPADLAQLWRERYSFAAGYWGNFGGLNVPLPPWAYVALNAAAVLAALGLLKLAIQRFSGLAGQQLPFAICNLQFAICLLWGLGVFLPWALSWARETWSSQGRLIFSALPVWSLLLALGLAGWLPRRWGHRAAGAFAAFLFTLTAAAPFAWITPAYAPPQPWAGEIPHRLDVDFGGVMHLLGYDVETEATEPGGRVGVTLYWEAMAPADRDYTVFVHLLGEGELLVAQRDTFPGLGKLATTRLTPGLTWADRYVLQLPETVYAPDTAQVEVGLYDRTSGARLLTGRGVDNVRFGRVEVRPRSTPFAVNFGNRMELTGYDLDRRVFRPGETLTLTLHWRGRRKMAENYNVSVQVIDAAWRKAAQRDGWPLDGAAPTSAWLPGEPLTDVYALPIAPDAAPGVYEVRVVVYLYQDGVITHIPTVPPDGRMQSTSIVLTTVRIAP